MSHRCVWDQANSQGTWASASAHDLALCGGDGSVSSVLRWDMISKLCMISKTCCIEFESFCSDQAALNNCAASVKYCLGSTCLESMSCADS